MIVREEQLSRPYLRMLSKKLKAYLQQRYFEEDLILIKKSLSNTYSWIEHSGFVTLSYLTHVFMSTSGVVI